MYAPGLSAKSEFRTRRKQIFTKDIVLTYMGGEIQDAYPTRKNVCT
jgi:hypothetical protein